MTAGPFALVASDRGVRKLYAVDAAATALGLYPGQKAPDAMALVPELVSAEADPVGDLTALDALVDWCVRFSPAVAADRCANVEHEYGHVVATRGPVHHAFDDAFRREVVRIGGNAAEKFAKPPLAILRCTIELRQAVGVEQQRRTHGKFDRGATRALGVRAQTERQPVSRQRFDRAAR